MEENRGIFHNLTNEKIGSGKRASFPLPGIPGFRMAGSLVQLPASAMSYADAHCHLQDSRIAPQLDAVLRRACEADVAYIHVNATSEADWTSTAALEGTPCSDGPVIRVSFGLHPWNAADAAPGWADRLRTFLLAHPRAGIGESGLDGSMPGGVSDAQWEAFRMQWEMSVALRRPISIHGRGAWSPLLEFILSQPIHPVGVLLHAYGGSPDALPVLAGHNVGISLGGTLANPANRRARRIACAAIPGHFLLETDSPDMAPPMAHFSEPAQLPATATIWADLLSMPLSTFAARTTATFLRLFP